MFDSEGSYSQGIEFIDKVSFRDEDDDQVEMLLGCAYHQSNALNESIVNGVLALAPNTTNNLIKQYFHSKIVNSSKFSICIGKDNGYMSIGEYDRSKHLENQNVNHGISQ